MVRIEGLDPPWVASLVPKTSVSTNSTISAINRKCKIDYFSRVYIYFFKELRFWFKGFFEVNFENLEIIFAIYIKFYYKSKLWQQLIGCIFNSFIRIIRFKGFFWVIFLTFQNFEIIFWIYIKFYYKLYYKFLDLRGLFSYFLFWNFQNHIWNLHSILL